MFNDVTGFDHVSKSWVFADTTKGATTNAILYTLVESAKQNELNRVWLEIFFRGSISITVVT